MSVSSSSFPDTHSVAFTFRHTEGSDALKTHATEKLLSVLSKYIHKPTRAHFIMYVEKGRHVAEVTFHADGADFVAEGESGDMYQSVDKAVDTVAVQLRKRKEKLVDHHHQTTR